MQKATHSRFELFQYTACRSLALERCKFVSASVMRLRENVARAIIPPVLVQPWFPSSFCVHAPSVPRDASFTTSQRSEARLQVPSYLNGMTSVWITLIPFRRDPLRHLYLRQIYVDFLIAPAAYFQVAPSFVFQFCFQRNNTIGEKARRATTFTDSWGPCLLVFTQLLKSHPSRWTFAGRCVYLPLLSSSSTAEATRCAHCATNPPSDGQDVLTRPSTRLSSPLVLCTDCVYESVRLSLFNEMLSPE